MSDPIRSDTPEGRATIKALGELAALKKELREAIKSLAESKRRTLEFAVKVGKLVAESRERCQAAGQPFNEWWDGGFPETPRRTADRYLKDYQHTLRFPEIRFKDLKELRDHREANPDPDKPKRARDPVFRKKPANVEEIDRIVASRNPITSSIPKNADGKSSVLPFPRAKPPTPDPIYVIDEGPDEDEDEGPCGPFYEATKIFLKMIKSLKSIGPRIREAGLILEELEGTPSDVDCIFAVLEIEPGAIAIALFQPIKELSERR